MHELTKHYKDWAHYYVLYARAATHQYQQISTPQLLDILKLALGLAGRQIK